MFDNIKNSYEYIKKAKKIEKELKNTHIEAEVDGLIVTIDGKQTVISAQIPDSLLNDKKKLANAFVTATNKAVHKSQQIAADLMKDIMGGLNLPGAS